VLTVLPFYYLFIKAEFRIVVVVVVVVVFVTVVKKQTCCQASCDTTIAPTTENLRVSAMLLF
jgi:hypothetical protein